MDDELVLYRDLEPKKGREQLTHAMRTRCCREATDQDYIATTRREVGTQQQQLTVAAQL
jgi:hypothetical protein